MRFRERFEERRDELKQKHGAFWLVVAVVLIVWTIVSAWGNWDTVVAHRSLLGTLLFATIRVLTTPATPFLALVAVVGWLGWLFFLSPVPGTVVADQSAAEPTTEPHVPGRDYGATLTQEVVGQGRYRVLLSGLREVANGWDRGVRLEVELPSGKIIGGGGWQGLDTPVMRRMVEQGGGVGAEAEGPYVIRWRSMPTPPYESEVIAEETVVLGPTGPLDGWIAHHAPLAMWSCFN